MAISSERPRGKSDRTRIKTADMVLSWIYRAAREANPTEQGLRLIIPLLHHTHSLRPRGKSDRTRIKTQTLWVKESGTGAREANPTEQGLRREELQSNR